MLKVAIVVLNFNGEKDTIQCLESIEKLQVPNTKLQIIVVDNGSKEEFTIKSDKLKKLSIKVIRNEENLGFAGGNNVGIRYALEQGADYVMVLNNDTIVDKNLILELIKAMRENEKVGIAAPKIYFAAGYEYHKTRYKTNEQGKVIWYAGGEMDWKNIIGYHRGVDEVDRGQFDKSIHTEFATGNCMLVKREVFEKVGLFDERYFLYYEDSDFSMRVKKASFKIFFEPLAVLWHKNAASAGGSGSALQDYYITRNRLLFGSTYAPLRTKIALFRESIKILFSGRHWQKKGVQDFYLRRFGKGSYRS